MTRLPTFAELLALMQLTFQSPREGAAEVLSRMPHREAIWLMFALVTVLTVLAGEMATLMAAGPWLSVWTLLALQAGAFMMMVLLMYHVGRSFGGAGSFDGALLLVTWLQFIFIFVQIAQVVAFLLLPFTAALIAILSVGLFLWLLVHFVAELHGFTAMAQVVMGVIGTLFALGIVVAMVLSALGIEIQPGATE